METLSSETKGGVIVGCETNDKFGVKFFKVDVIPVEGGDHGSTEPVGNVFGIIDVRRDSSIASVFIFAGSTKTGESEVLCLLLKAFIKRTASLKRDLFTMCHAAVAAVQH